MEAEGKTGRGQTMRVFEGQIKRLSIIPRVKRRHGGVWSECFRRALWPQNVGGQGGRQTREEAAERVYMNPELGERRLNPAYCASRA